MPHLKKSDKTFDHTFFDHNTLSQKFRPNFLITPLIIMPCLRNSDKTFHPFVECFTEGFAKVKKERKNYITFSNINLKKMSSKSSTNSIYHLQIMEW